MHAHGLYNGSTLIKAVGTISSKLEVDPEYLPSKDQALIGHCRLSTSGTPKDTANNQPIVAGKLAVAHNGNIYNSEALAYEYSLRLTSACDSEALPVLISSLTKTSSDLDALIKAVSLIDASPGAFLLYGFSGDLTGAVVAIRRKLPLWEWSQPEGVYFCSVRPACQAKEVSDNAITIFQHGKQVDLLSIKPAETRQIALGTP